MPLLDHFHPPLSVRRHWESFHAAWASTLADALNQRWLPEGYFAEEDVHAGARASIDVATFEEKGANGTGQGAATVTLPTRVWSPPAPQMVMLSVFPSHFEVQVFQTEGGYHLVAAIELISPGNKDRTEHRHAFAIKCASLLLQGVSVVLIDIVTSRQANLHDEIVRLLERENSFLMPADSYLYAVAYRPIRRGQADEIDIWPRSLSVGQPLPEMPLALGGDLCVPLDLENTYMDVCRRRRWIDS